MRSIFLPDNVFNDNVLPKISWAAIIVRFDGGWQAYESIDDYQTWLDQK